MKWSDLLAELRERFAIHATAGTTKGLGEKNRRGVRWELRQKEKAEDSAMQMWI